MDGDIYFRVSGSARRAVGALITGAGGGSWDPDHVHGLVDALLSRAGGVPALAIGIQALEQCAGSLPLMAASARKDAEHEFNRRLREVGRTDLDLLVKPSFSWALYERFDRLALTRDFLERLVDRTLIYGRDGVLDRAGRVAAGWARAQLMSVVQALAPRLAERPDAKRLSSRRRKKKITRDTNLLDGGSDEG